MGVLAIMNTKMIKELKKKFVGWTSKEINIARQMILFLDQNKISISEFMEYVDELKKHIVKQRILMEKHLQDKMPKCPECGSIMAVEPVNVSNSTRIDDKSINSVFTCNNLPLCGHQIWSKETASSFMKNLLNSK